MRILVISDTHRKDYNFYTVLEKVGKVDMIIHCGDTEGSEYEMENVCGCTFVAVMGNNDWFSYTPKEKELSLEGHRIFVTHGNAYGVHTSNARLVDEALDRGCDIVLYGHTHIPELCEKRGVTVLNPGSLSYPRQTGRKPSYAIMKLKENEKPEIEIYYLERD